MKKIALAGATLVLVLAAGSASAANSLSSGTVGLNIALTDTGVQPNGAPGNFVVNGKYFMAKDMALIAGFGFGTWGSDAKGTDIGFAFGMRKYLNTNDFAPFVGARFQYQVTGDSAAANGKTTALGIIGEAGAEYFLSKQFSLEGRVGFGYLSGDNTNGGTTTKATYIGTQSMGISANFYF